MPDAAVFACELSRQVAQNILIQDINLHRLGLWLPPSALLSFPKASATPLQHLMTALLRGEPITF
jgi:hypothetical protein